MPLAVGDEDVPLVHTHAARVAEAVAVAAAERSALPEMLTDLSSRARGVEGAPKLAPGRSPSVPLHVVVVPEGHLAMDDGAFMLLAGESRAVVFTARRAFDLDAFRRGLAVRSLRDTYE